MVITDNIFEECLDMWDIMDSSYEDGKRCLYICYNDGVTMTFDVDINLHLVNNYQPRLIYEYVARLLNYLDDAYFNGQHNPWYVEDSKMLYIVDENCSEIIREANESESKEFFNNIDWNELLKNEKEIVN